eukprot:5972152-Heterocapsa_arctica.AAC.1
MTQGEPQDPVPMEQDPGSDLTPEEQEAWNKSEAARAEELGMAMAAELTAAKEEATKSAEARKPSRSPDSERVLRRALRSPSRERNSKAGGGGSSPMLAPVLEEGAEQKVPSDEEEEVDPEEKEVDGAQENQGETQEDDP